MIQLYVKTQTVLHAMKIAAARRLQSKRGASMVEYGVVVALVAGIAVAALAILGPKMNTFFGTVGDNVTAAL